MLVVLGMTIGAGLSWIRFKSLVRQISLTIKTLQQEVESARIENSQACAIAEERKKVLEKQEQDLTNLRSQYSQLEKENVAFEAKKADLELRLKQINTEEEERHRKALLEFDLLARKLLDEKTK